ncbi:hypothetical protein [Streptomyces noursei]|uniref:hypothetical protein n=1 Tax=Streptomyces noursei TaxID=1971 RepID=UPI00199CB711|nr:hypothetical protein [Streptomyces noursei]MCZ1018366.1 hypothetical protein [Streptomyces noursei]GGW88395.1 hypothetical protein GCM10010341_06500 [Streptomyces noursei]
MDAAGRSGETTVEQGPVEDEQAGHGRTEEGRTEHDQVEQDRADDGQADDSQDDDPAESGRMGLTPRQARRVRVVLASVMMAAMAVLLVVRLATRHSVLVVGVYGAALILCGIVIELARNGRTRLGTWLLGLGLTAAIAADWLLLP